MQRDTYHNLAMKVSVSPLIRNGNTGTNGAAVDLRGFESATVFAICGLITDGTVVTTIEESDDGSTGWAAPDAKYIRGASSLSTAEDPDAEAIGYFGNKNFIRAVQTQSGATTGGTYGAVVVLGHPKYAPVTQS